VTERFGPYELLRVVGRGGMGEVLEARDTEHDRIVALKRLTTEAAGDDEYQRRFRREARLVARLRNPHVIPIHRYGEIDGQLFLDMPLIGGADLEQVLRAEGRLAPARAVAIVEQVASALDAAHRAGLVHRDVKPSNVLIDDEVGAHGFVYLVDFGITRSVGGDDASAPLTGARILIGSLDYMAPERFSGEGGVGIDVYALACLLFECLTGSRPFPVDEFTELMTAHLYGKPPAPSQSVPGLGEAFDAVIASGLAKDPEQRPASAGEFAAAARAALDARSGTAVPSTPTTAEGLRSVVEPLPAAATRRGGTQKSDAPAPLDAPTTVVPRTTASATTEGDATTLLPAAHTSAVSAAPGPRTGRPGAPPRRDPPPVWANGQPSMRTGVQPPAGGAAGAGRAAGADARPAGTSDREDRTVALRVRDPRAGSVPGPAPSGARPAWTPGRESPPSAPRAGDPRAGSVPGPAVGPAPPGPPDDPTPSVPPTGGRSRKALWVALVVLAAVLVIAAAVYVAVLLTPATG
jgi:serine/threonine protein kinase